MRGSLTRRPLAPTVTVAALVAILAVAGCGAGAAADGVTSRWPAAAAGGACQLLDYDSVAAGIGVRFDTAGSAAKGETYTCALTQSGQEYPYLTLAVTATAADAVIFTATVTPSGSTPVKGLGSVAYRLKVAESAKSGPGAEVGWLSANGRIMIVRFMLSPGSAAEDLDALTPKLVELATQIDAVGT